MVFNFNEKDKKIAPTWDINDFGVFWVEEG
jgi:hypothetical protein